MPLLPSSPSEGSTVTASLPSSPPTVPSTYLQFAIDVPRVPGEKALRVSTPSLLTVPLFHCVPHNFTLTKPLRWLCPRTSKTAALRINHPRPLKSCPCPPSSLISLIPDLKNLSSICYPSARNALPSSLLFFLLPSLTPSLPLSLPSSFSSFITHSTQTHP